jgi:hypothetical protein
MMGQEIESADHRERGAAPTKNRRWIVARSWVGWFAPDSSDERDRGDARKSVFFSKKYLPSRKKHGQYRVVG